MIDRSITIHVDLTSADGATGQGFLQGEMQWDTEPELQTESAYFTVLEDGNQQEVYQASGDQWRDLESSGMQDALLRRVCAGQSISDFFENRSVDIEIYDNAGETFDRYTVIYLDDIERKTHEGVLYACRAMSEHPYHPQGFGQYSSAMSGPHLGKRICFADLPEDCRVLVASDLGLDKDGQDAARYLDDSEFSGQYASLLESGAIEASQIESSLNINPFAAIYAVARTNGLEDELKGALLRLVEWENFDPKDLNDDLLQEIFHATGIAVQYNEDGTYQAFLQVHQEQQVEPVFSQPSPS